MQPAESYASKRRHSSQKALARTAFGAGVALSCLPLACVWFLLRANDIGPEIDPVALAQSKAVSVAAAKPAAPVAQVVAAQTAPAAPVAPANPAPAEANATVALLDVTGSIGAPAATFSKRPPGQLDYRFSSPTPPPAAATQEAPKPAAALVVRQQAAAPVPAPRPAERVQTASLAMPAPSEFRAPPSPSPLLDQKVAKNKVLSNTAVLRLFEKIRGKPQQEQLALGYAPTESGLFSDSTSFTPAVTGPIDQYTAVYDITAAIVYMPDGTKLEAHSGLGPMKDKPQHAHVRMHGVTPPHIYDLKLRESLFHGVRAIRLTPVLGEKGIFGRNGILAHTYMLGPRGDSNGCVSFKDYNAFLQAFLKGEVKRMAVVGSLD